VLSKSAVEQIHRSVAQTPGYQLTVDLESLTVSDDAGFSESFEIDAFRRQCFLEGLDHIALTLQHEDKIDAYEQALP
jgi:3-isopropylmalate/(R)-2-methylmalate dehydratase small subunit